MRTKRVWLPVVVCLFLVLTSACTEDPDEESASSTTDASSTEDIEPSGLLPDDGDCDPALPVYPIGIMTVFESPVLSLIDQVKGAEASVEAFNARGGVGGHCMDLTTCDTQLDPNGEVDCARQFADDGIVATVNDTTAANPSGVIDVTQGAGIPRIGVSPGSDELNAPNSYPISGGSVGTTIMMFPTLARRDLKKIALIHVDTPQVQALPAVLEPLLQAYDAEITEMVPVPAGTTDYQQFVLAAEDSGADGVVLALGESEAVQVLRAAQQLGSDLTFSLSLGTFSQADMEEFGDFASSMVFNSEVPPATASLDEWPVLADVVLDLSASGDPDLQRDQIKSSAIRSWMAVNALVEVVEQAGDPDDITREAITAALEEATDVPFFGLVPPWTPSAGSGEGLFGNVSSPYYYQVTFDPETAEFVIADDLLNVVEESEGNTDYAQPEG